LGMGNLSNIRLGWNNLTGEIPSELGNLVIAFLDLRYNNLSGCLDMNLMNLCSVFDLYFYDNPLLPWEGDFSQFCATSESSTDQIGAPCDDGDPSNGTNDAINADCSCEPTVINGCTDATACNYNASATTNDGSCLYLDAPCDDGDDSNGTNDVIDEDCSCVPIIMGCIDATACNYNVSATIDDGSCLYPNICDACSGETDGTGTIIDGDLDNDGVCDCPGLMNDSLALVALYNATDGPNWTNTWTLTDPMSTWFGVTLSADGCSVTNLDLSNNELTGEIPPELGSLANLTILDLVYNNLIGEIPPELGNLVNLTGLYLAYNGSNGLTGEIPSELGNLVNLTELGLEWNNLTGQIPSELGSLANLTILDLADNSLTGEIPSELGNLVNLTYFNFGYNDLSGCLDMNLMNLCSVTIYSSYNPLLPWGGDFDQFCATSGSSIDQIGAPCDDGDDSNGTNDVINADCSCEPILVNGCIDANACNYNVSATINDGSCLYPNICDTCSGETDGTGIIIDGDLDDNGFCDIDQNCLTNDSLVLVALYNFTDGFNWTNTWTLTDPVSTWFGVNLSLDGCSVTYVDLAENNLTGEIPTELGNLSNLTVLDLDLNSLTGKIPMELENLSNLNILKLSFNGLTGEIPNELSNLLNLEDLFLNENNLTGEIPTELENLINLKNLQLSVNNLTGEIPNELSNLLDLERLSLNTNNLSGNIPTELGNLSNLTTLKLHDNELTGEIPPELGSLSNLTTLKLNDNELTGEIPPELGNLVNLLLINISSNNLSGCLDINLMNLCSVPTLNFSNNPILPWKGSFFQFCSTPGNSTDQIGTPCDDGDASNGTNDVINADCSCGPAIVGCTDTTACNYDPIAEFDDASCLYGSDCPSIGFELSAKIFLEGPYNGGGTMLSSLDDLIPLNQPYNTAPYNYMGTETALIIPDNVVDWVLVEMRSGIPSTTNQSTLLAEIKVGLLLENGNIVHTDGVSPLTFETLNEGESYYLCIRHRNHLDVLSATPITASNTMTYDFTTDANKAFGSQQLKELESGVYALYGGDYTHEGIIQTTDYDFWADAPAIINVYTNTDGTLDGVAQNTDYDLWFGNKAKIGVMEVRLE